MPIFAMVADVKVQAEQEVVSDGDGVIGEGEPEAHCWREFHFTIEGIDGRIDGFDGDELRIGACVGRGHGDHLGDLSGLGSAAADGVEALLLVEEWVAGTCARRHRRP